MPRPKRRQSDAPPAALPVKVERVERPADLALTWAPPRPIDLDLKALVPLLEARHLLPIVVSEVTIARWARIGVNGVRLRTVRYGSRQFTCKQWLAEFGIRSAGNSVEDTSAVLPSSAGRQRQIDAAMREAAARGI